MDIDYEKLSDEVYSGYFRERLREELAIGFRLLREEGEPIPLASYYATKIAEIVHNGSPQPIESTLAYEIYQEILSACEEARATVLGEPPPPTS